LFPGTAGGRGWNRFSAIDVSVVRTVVVMTKHGIPASGAISFAQKYLTAFFDNIWTAPEENAFCTFEMSLDGQEALFSIPPSDWSIQDVMANSTGIATVLSLRQIVEHVRPLLTAPQKG
jgi:hypothetical protein